MNRRMADNYTGRRGHFWVCLFLAVIIALGGCQMQSKKKEVNEDKPAIVKHYAKGPIKLKLTIDRRRINSAQFFHLALRVEGPENYNFEFPDPEDDDILNNDHDSGAGVLTVVGGNKTKIALAAKGIFQEQNYILEPEKPGKLKLPPLQVSAWEKGKDKAKVIELATGEIPLVVESLLTDGDSKLADIVPPVPQPVNWLWWSVGLAGGAAILLLGWFLWRRHKRKDAPPPPVVPPYLLALQAIEDLRHKDLPAHGRTKQFYAELSDILRQYIERQLGLRATEQTTEEFLAGLGSLARPASAEYQGVSSVPVLRAEHKRLLRDFLTHCDLVKFAEHKPNPDDIDSALLLCRQFINDTGAGGAAQDETPSAAAPGRSAKSLEFKP